MMIKILKIAVAESGDLLLITLLWMLQKKTWLPNHVSLSYSVQAYITRQCEMWK